MARKPKAPDELPSKAYLMSFGDTMTALCAFFIVLNSLAKEQTGANLHSGTGSFVKTMARAGLPGNLSKDKSRHAVQREEPSPLYLVKDPENREPSRNGSGPDEQDDGQRIIDRESDDFQRFINEMERVTSVREMPSADGESAFDFFEGLDRDAPHLNKAHLRAFSPILPRLKQQDYAIEVVVWATTPGPVPWARAAQRAGTIAQHIAKTMNLNAEQKARLSSVGRTWISSTEKRPVVTLIVRRLK